MVPIYEYRCSSCGFQKEYLQKVSDPLLSICPECKQETFSKMLTAAGFQLKGGGWYATDFKHSGSKPAGKSAAASKSESASESKSETQSAASAAPAAAASPAKAE
jgi:putative FmdB family regulatory protein